MIEIQMHTANPEAYEAPLCEIVAIQEMNGLCQTSPTFGSPGFAGPTGAFDEETVNF